MGLLDQLAQQVLGQAVQALTQGQTASLAQTIIGMLTDSKGGGLDGLVQQFQQQGLGELVASWVGTGQNQPATPDQITAALGRNRVDEISRQAGVPAADGPSILAQLLPVLVDKLTPTGQVPANAQLVDLGVNILKSLAKNT